MKLTLNVNSASCRTLEHYKIIRQIFTQASRCFNKCALSLNFYLSVSVVTSNYCCVLLCYCLCATVLLCYCCVILCYCSTVLLCSYATVRDCCEFISLLSFTSFRRFAFSTFKLSRAEQETWPWPYHGCIQTVIQSVASKVPRYSLRETSVSECIPYSSILSYKKEKMC